MMYPRTQSIDGSVLIVLSQLCIVVCYVLYALCFLLYAFCSLLCAVCTLLSALSCVQCAVCQTRFIQNDSKQLPKHCQAKCLQGKQNCLPGPFQITKMYQRSLPNKQNASKGPPRQPKCLPRLSQSSKLFPNSLPDSQNARRFQDKQNVSQHPPH